jgi:chitin synthase
MLIPHFSTDTEFEVKLWDAPRELKEDTKLNECASCYTWSIRIGKVLFIFFIFVVVLGCLASSKLSLLFITASMNPYFKFRETQDDAEGHYDASYSECGVPTCMFDRDKPENNVRWIWSLHMSMCVPYVFCCLKSLWKVAFKKKASPDKSTVLWAIFVESLHTIGLFTLAFLGLPRLDAFRGVLILCSLGVVPSFLQALTMDNVQRRDRVGDAVAAFVQFGALLSWFLYIIVEPVIYGDSTGLVVENVSIGQDEVCSNVNTTYTSLSEYFMLNETYFLVESLPEEAIDYWFIPVGVLLTSIVWWENFIGKCTPEDEKNMSWREKIATRLYEHKLDLQKCHVKVNVFVTIWKLILSTGLLFLFFSVSAFPWSVAQCRIYTIGNPAVRLFCKWHFCSIQCFSAQRSDFAG